MQPQILFFDLSEKEAELRYLTDIDKYRVISEVMEGINLAKLQANAGNVIDGRVHIGKIPEVMRVEPSAESEVHKAKLEKLSDKQLLAIINRRGNPP